MRDASRLRRVVAALWAAFVALWMPGLFDGHGSEAMQPQMNDDER